jgi:hypothetical protein
MIDCGFRNLRQRRIGLVFFVERLIEQPNRVVQAEFLRLGLQRTVSRDLIMLDRLHRRQQAGIERRRALVFLHDLGALIGDADNGVAGLGLRPFVYHAENLFKPRDMAFRLAVVLFEGLFQIGRLRGFGQSICLLTYRENARPVSSVVSPWWAPVYGRCAWCIEALWPHV